MGISAFVGAINTFFVHPWDVVKTLHQKNEPLRMGVWATFKTLFKEQGLEECIPDGKRDWYSTSFNPVLQFPLLNILDIKEKLCLIN